MGPAHRYLVHPPTEPGAQVQDLHVEGPPVHGGQREQRPRRGALEQLEPALAVGHLEPGHRPDHPVAELAEQFPDPSLVHPDPGRVGPGADRPDRTRTHRPESFQLLDRGGQVGVADENPLSDGGPHPLPYGESLAAVVRVAHQLDPRLVGRGGSYQVGGVVGRAVVDDDQLPGQPAAAEVLVDPVERGSEAGLFVVGGNNHGQINHPSGRCARLGVEPGDRGQCGRVVGRASWGDVGAGPGGSSTHHSGPITHSSGETDASLFLHEPGALMA